MEDLAGWKTLYQKLRKMAICFSIQVSLIAFQLQWHPAITKNPL